MTETSRKVKYRDELERRQGQQKVLRDRYIKLRTKGICVECGQNPAVGGVRCPQCKLKPHNPDEKRGRPREFSSQEAKDRQKSCSQQSQKRRRERLKADGKCLWCGHNPANGKAGMCQACYGLHLERKRRSRVTQTIR